MFVLLCSLKLKCFLDICTGSGEEGAQLWREAVNEGDACLSCARIFWHHLGRHDPSIRICRQISREHCLLTHINSSRLYFPLISEWKLTPKSHSQTVQIHFSVSCSVIEIFIIVCSYFALVAFLLYNTWQATLWLSQKKFQISNFRFSILMKEINSDIQLLFPAG